MGESRAVLRVGGVLAFVVGHAGDVGEGILCFGQDVLFAEFFQAGVGDVCGRPEGEVLFAAHRWGCSRLAILSRELAALVW